MLAAILRLYRPAPMPLHVVLGDNALVDLAMQGLRGLVVVCKLGAVPALLALAWVQGLTLATASVAGLWTLWLAHRAGRRPRSCAAPLAEDTLLLGGFLVIALGLAAVSGAAPVGVGAAVLGGVGAAILVLLLMGLGIWAAWGRGHRFAVLRQPTFRVLGDNPDARNTLGRARIGPGGLRLVVPRTAEGPGCIVVYSLGLQSGAMVSWDQLRGPLEERGEVSVWIGEERPDAFPREPTDFQLRVPPGRCLISVRAYRPLPAQGQLLPRQEPA